MTTYLQDIDYDFRVIKANIESGDGAEDAHRYWLAQLFSSHHDLLDWEADQFSDWYSNHPEHWKPVSNVTPLSGVHTAYQAWLRRP